MIINARMHRIGWPEQKPGMGWVYILYAGEPAAACKVGTAVDLFNRLRQQSYRYRDRKFPVGLHCAYRVPLGDKARDMSQAAEVMAHNRLMSWRFSVSGGDWFLLRPNKVETVVRVAITDTFGGDYTPERFPS